MVHHPDSLIKSLVTDVTEVAMYPHVYPPDVCGQYLGTHEHLPTQLTYPLLLAKVSPLYVKL